MTKETLGPIQGMTVYLSSLVGGNTELAEKIRQRFGIQPGNSPPSKKPDSEGSPATIKNLPDKETQ